MSRRWRGVSCANLFTGYYTDYSEGDIWDFILKSLPNVFMHSEMTTYVTMASNWPKLSAMAAFRVIHRGGVYSQAVKKVVVVKSKEQWLREACSYTFDLFNAGCGSGHSVEGGYLHKTLKGKVVRHGVALDPDVTDIGARTQTVFHCSVALPYFISWELLEAGS